MEINFVITCYNRELFYLYYRKILESFKKIKPHVALCYNGNSKLIPWGFEPHFITENKINGGRGFNNHPSGCTYSDADMELTIGGYEFLKNNGIKNWVKLSADSWLLDEEVIMQIFKKLEKTKCAYAGNMWYSKWELSTDIMFINTEQHNLFEDFKKYGKEFFDYVYENKNPRGFEFFMQFLCQAYDILIIQDREPLHPEQTRWAVPALGWTMSHDLMRNILFYNRFESVHPYNKKIELVLKKGDGRPYSLERHKCNI